VIVVDISMPNLNGLEAIRQLQKRGVRAKTIVVTMHAGVDFAVQALRLGVSGYVLKVDASEELARAMQEALAGRHYITPSIANDVTEILMQRPGQASADDETWSKVSAREREVLQLVAEGHGWLEGWKRRKKCRPTNHSPVRETRIQPYTASKGRLTVVRRPGDTRAKPGKGRLYRLYVSFVPAAFMS